MKNRSRYWIRENKVKLVGGGGGSTPKKPKQPSFTSNFHFGFGFFGFFVFFWKFLKNFFKSSLAHCNAILVEFKSYISPFIIILKLVILADFFDFN